MIIHNHFPSLYHLISTGCNSLHAQCVYFALQRFFWNIYEDGIQFQNIYMASIFAVRYKSINKLIINLAVCCFAEYQWIHWNCSEKILINLENPSNSKRFVAEFYSELNYLMTSYIRGLLLFRMFYFLRISKCIWHNFFN